jgi:hypothetical protein
VTEVTLSRFGLIGPRPVNESPPGLSFSERTRPDWLLKMPDFSRKYPDAPQAVEERHRR